MDVITPTYLFFTKHGERKSEGERVRVNGLDSVLNTYTRPLMQMHGFESFFYWFIAGVRGQFFRLYIMFVSEG